MAADPAALEPDKGSGTAIQLVSEISNELLKFQLPPTCRLVLADKIARLRLILAAGPATASPTVPDAPDRPISRPAGPREALLLSSDKLDQATRLNASGPPTPGTRMDLGGTESTSMGGRRNAAVLQPAPDTPAIDHQQQQHSADLPPQAGAEASSSLSHPTEHEWVQVGFQKLTKAFESLASRLSERLNEIESKNPFAALENNADTPARPVPAASYTPAAAKPVPPPCAAHAAKIAPAARLATPTSRKVVVLKVTSLPESHPLRSFPPNRLLSASRLFLQSSRRDFSGTPFPPHDLFHWIAGHEGVEGNEIADEMARRGSEEGIEASAAAERKRSRRRRIVIPREAAEVSLSSLDNEGSSYWEEETSGVAAGQVRRGPLQQLTPGETDEEGRIAGGGSLPKSTASVLQAAKAALKLQWEKEWAASLVGAALRAVDPSPPSSAFRRRLRALPRPLASLLTRLRTDFSSLAHPMYRARLHPNGLCECGDQETREHFFIHCPLYISQRAALLSSLPTRHLPPLSSLLSSAAFLPAVLTYINATDRFPRLHATRTENGGGAAKR
ncbi:hypothetical protein JCM11641_004025 [Rhodosporidiobolus odoratus]